MLWNSTLRDASLIGGSDFRNVQQSFQRGAVSSRTGPLSPAMVYLSRSTERR